MVTRNNPVQVMTYPLVPPVTYQKKLKELLYLSISWNDTLVITMITIMITASTGIMESLELTLTL